MIDILFILSLPLAAFGLFLIVTFLMIRFQQDIYEAEITGFQKTKNKGRYLPIVSFTDEEGEEKMIEVKTIDQISYLLNPSIEKQIIPIAAVKSARPKVFGYLSLVIGVICIVPALALSGLYFERALLTGQVLYSATLIGLILGGWIVLKLIQRL